ncbi:alpha/beta fold hydrolase [Bdellovibrionota bacterium FG-1]
MRTCGLFLVFVGLAVNSATALASTPQRGPLPVVFAHGLGVSSLPYEALFALKQLFRDRGHEFLIAETPSNGTIEERAAILRDEIHRLVPQGSMHLIGHSMGGLDCRLVVHRYGLGDRIASITTLATPHHGSPLADFVVKHLAGGNAVLSKWFEGDLRAAHELTTDYMDRIFNPEVQNDPRVRYFSAGFYIPGSIFTHSLVPWLWVAHEIIAKAGFPENDGMVSLQSAEWGKFLGALPGDHYSETGPIPLRGGPSYLEVFKWVLDHLEKTVEKDLK